jgi:hypothetical protein
VNISSHSGCSPDRLTLGGAAEKSDSARFESRSVTTVFQASLTDKRVTAIVSLAGADAAPRRIANGNAERSIGIELPETAEYG